MCDAERFEIKISVDWLHVMDISVHRILLAFQLIIPRETNMTAHKKSQDNTAVFLCIYVDLQYYSVHKNNSMFNC